MNSTLARTLLFGIGLTLVLSGARADAPLSVAWQQTFGGTNTETFGSLQQTTDGGYVLGGASYSGVTGNKTTANYGDYDYWVIKLNSAGAKVWEADFGGTNTESVTLVQQVSDGGYLVGGASFSGISGNKTNTWYGSSDGWLIKLNANGARLWERSFGGSSLDNISAVRMTSESGYIVAGSSWSGISGNKTSPLYGLYDAWILKLDANGNKLWDNSFGGTGTDSALAIEVTDDGGYIFAGSSSSPVSGNKTSPNYGGTDYWLVKLDSGGNKQWENTYGGSATDTLSEMLPTPDHGYLLGGHSSSGVSGTKTSPNYGGTDFWVVKVDSNGNQVWDYSFGGSGNEELRSLALTSDGGYLLGGYSASPVSGNKTSPNYGAGDYWLVKLDADGNKVWEQTFGGTGDDYLYAVQETQDRGIILGGYSSSPVSGNKTSIQYGSSSDMWIIKLDRLRPQLTISRSDQQVVLSWPSPSTGFVLEQNSELATTGWTTVPGTPNDDGTTKWVARDTGAARVFYRLVAP